MGNFLRQRREKADTRNMGLLGYRTDLDGVRTVVWNDKNINDFIDLL